MSFRILSFRRYSTSRPAVADVFNVWFIFHYTTKNWQNCTYFTFCLPRIIQRLGIEKQNFGGFGGRALGWLGSGKTISVTSPIVSAWILLHSIWLAHYYQSSPRLLCARKERTNRVLSSKYCFLNTFTSHIRLFYI